MSPFRSRSLVSASLLRSLAPLSPALLSPALLSLALLSVATTRDLPAQRDLATVFPADTWAYTECAGLENAARAFHAASLVGIVKQVLGEEGGQALEMAAREKGGRDLDEARGVFARAGIDQAQVRRLLSGAFAIGVGRPTIMGANVLPSIALVAAVGSGGEAREAVAACERVLTEKLPVRLPSSTKQVGGVECTALSLPGGAGQVLHLVHDGLWFVTNSEGYLLDCLATARGQAPSLAKNASLGHGRGQLAGSRMAAAFVNVQQFGHVVAPFLPYEVAGIGRALGVTAPPDLFAGFAHDGKSAHDVLELTLPGPSDGLVKSMFKKSVTNRAAQWVKPTTTLFASVSLDVPEAQRALERVFAALPARIGQEIQRNVQRAFKRGGAPVAELTQVLAAIGPEISIAVDTPAPPMFSFTAFVEVRDHAAAENLVRGLLARTGHGDEVQFEEAEGAKIWSTELRMQNMRMTPALALRDGWLVCSNFKNVVKRTLRATSLGSESLAADARFQAAAKAADGAALFVTGRLQPVLDGFWGLATVGASAGARALGFEPAQLPDADEMASALDDIVLVGRASEQGFTLRVQQPLGIGTMLPAAAAALDWFLSSKPAPRPAAQANPKPVVKKIY